MEEFNTKRELMAFGAGMLVLFTIVFILLDKVGVI